MANKQTRRCVSLSRSVYDTLKAYCNENKVSMSGIIEGLVAEMLADVRCTPVTKDKVTVAAPTKPDGKRAPGNIESF